jgi:hypothetical protein
VAAPAATAPGAEVDVCFALTLPAGAPDSLQGLAAGPVWAFTSISR